MKKRVITALLIFAVSAGGVLPVLALDTHALLSRNTQYLTWEPWTAWGMVLHDERVGKFYLLYCAALFTLLVWVLITGNYLKYRSDMQQITPDICTPKPEGQGQFGTARWMRQEEIGRFFHVWKVPRKAPWFQELMAAGLADRREIENAHVKIQ